MKTFTQTKLSNEIIKVITSYFPSKIFKSQSHLFYEGQIPISGYLVINGAIIITQKKKVKNVLQTGHLIGIDELLRKNPIKVSAEVLAETEICFLDKSTLLEMSKDPNSNISSFIQLSCKMPLGLA